MELVDLIRGAQDAMDRGDYAHTASACAHALETFPGCFAAHRMLAEAYLEQGRIDAAIEHFNRALAIDPLNVVARLGLGVASEEKRDVNTAYSAYLHAWETNPALDQVRDELVRLRGLLGGDERLHPTRAGLAGVYARGGQFGRAAAEWRAVLMTEPNNVRARTALAEILWRSGDDLAASTSCRDALVDVPENARALALLSEIEQRRGSMAASELVDRYHSVDPLGEIVTLMSEWRDGADFSGLLVESASVPDFDPSSVPAFDHYEAAPKVGVAAAGAAGLAAGHFAAPDLWDTIVKDLGTETLNFNELPPIDNGVQPFSWQDESATDGLPVLEPFSLDTMQPAQGAMPDDLQHALPPLPTAPLREPLSLDDAIASLSPQMGPVADPASASIPLQVEEAAPVAGLVAVGALAAVEVARNDKFVTSDGRVDLTVGWDDLDRQLKEATPTFDNAAEIDALAASLGVDGVVPFDAGENPFDDAAWAPFTDDDLGMNGVPAAPAPLPAPAIEAGAEAAISLEEPAAALQGWDIDDEIASAIPSQQSTGYTEMLRHIDIEAPFDADQDGMVNPFANPDTSGDPLVFEDLLAVTSRDGTAPLAAPPEMFVGNAAIASDIVPFDAAELESIGIDGAEAPAWLSESTADVSREAPPATQATDLPLDENPFALEELLRSSASAEAGNGVWQPAPQPFAAPADPISAIDIAPTPAQDESADLAALAIAATLAELSDLQPFSIEEAEVEVQPNSDVVDFSDINDAPFDPQALAGMIEPAAQPTILPDWAADADQVAASLISETQTASPWEETVTAEVLIAEPVFAPVAVAAEVPAEEPTRTAHANGTAWPAFVNHTSELIDRESNGNLFGRLRDGKRSAVSSGLLIVDRSIGGLCRDVAASVAVVDAVHVISTPIETPSAPPPAGSGTNGLTDEERVELMTMRVRLIEDAESAAEVAQALEAAIARGMNDPLALRVLGEAYLKLGKTEQAAAQFRQAMLARRRSW